MYSGDTIFWLMLVAMLGVGGRLVTLHKHAFYCYIGNVVWVGFTIPDEEQN